jgi:hypothetical protein
MVRRSCSCSCLCLGMSTPKCRRRSSLLRLSWRSQHQLRAPQPHPRRWARRPTSLSSPLIPRCAEFDFPFADFICLAFAEEEGATAREGGDLDEDPIPCIHLDSQLEQWTEEQWGWMAGAIESSDDGWTERSRWDGGWCGGPTAKQGRSGVRPATKQGARAGPTTGFVRKEEDRAPDKWVPPVRMDKKEAAVLAFILKKYS